MTEYDYSPEAYEKYLESQNKIARWVNRTNMVYSDLRNPFDPATPAVDVIRGDLPDDRYVYRNAGDIYKERKHSKKEKEKGRDRDREKEKHRPQTLRSASHAQSASYGDVRLPPTRAQTAPPKTRRTSYDHYLSDPEYQSSSKYDGRLGSKYDLSASGKYESRSGSKYDLSANAKYDSRHGSKYDLSAYGKYDSGSGSKYDLSKPAIYDQNQKKRPPPLPIYAPIPVQPTAATRRRPSRSNTLPSQPFAPNDHRNNITPIYAPAAPVYPNHGHPPQRLPATPPRQQSAPQVHYAYPDARPHLQRQPHYSPVIPDPVIVSPKPQPLLKRLFTGLTGSKNTQTASPSPESPTFRSGVSSYSRPSLDSYNSRPLSSPNTPRRDERDRDRNRERKRDRESSMRRRRQSH